MPTTTTQPTAYYPTRRIVPGGVSFVPEGMTTAEFVAEVHRLSDIELTDPFAEDDAPVTRPLSVIETERIAARDAKENLTDQKFAALKAGRMDDYWRLGDEEAKAQVLFNALNVEARQAGKVW